MKQALILILVFALTLGAVSDDKLVRQARRIHEQVLTLDTHADTTFALFDPAYDIGRRHEPGKRGSGKQDLVRMKEGGLDASFFSVFVGQGPLTPEGFAKAKQEALRSCDALDVMFQKYPALCQKALTPADAYRSQKKGQRAIFLGMENAYPLGTDLALLDYFWQRGVRYVTLGHTADNEFCDSSTDRRHTQDHGLSELGRQLVARLNELGIMVDVSHISDKSFEDVLAVTRAPVVASHSSCRALCDNPRNLSDDMLRALKKNGGVIQLCILADYVKTMPSNPERDQAFADFRKRIAEQFGSRSNITDPAVRQKLQEEFEQLDARFPRQLPTVKDVVDHIDHVVKLLGSDYVGIGTDFDGGGGVLGCNDVTEMPNITIELVRRGYSKKDIAKIWSGNFFRVFQRVLDLAKKPVTH